MGVAGSDVAMIAAHIAQRRNDWALIDFLQRMSCPRSPTRPSLQKRASLYPEKDLTYGSHTDILQLKLIQFQLEY
jgi:hypothetical protein